MDNFRFQTFVSEHLRAPGNREGIEMTSLYDKALAKSAGAPLDSEVVAGRKLLPEPERQAAESPSYSAATALALLVGAGVFLAGAWRKRDGR